METRQQILCEAREVFLEQGLAGFSMRTVAQRVGVSATAIYRHFDDKDALIASMLGDAFGTFGEYLRRSLKCKTPLERFRRCGEAYIAFALDHPRDYELMFLTNCEEQGFKKISEEVGQRSRPTFEFLVERIVECLECKVFAPRDPLQLALFAWSTLHGIASLWLLGQLKEAGDQRVFREQAALTLDFIELSLRSGETARRR